MKRIPLVAALLTLAVHLIGNPHYGFYRDELYFIACGFHPDWGYVDQPPLVPLLSAGSQLFGHSLFALRALPAIFAAAGVYVTCLLVIELGGGAFAQVLAGIVAAFLPILSAFGTKVSTDMPGLWLWPLIALYVARLSNGADRRLWLAAGAALGVACEAKYTVLFFGAALVVGLALTPQRRILLTPWALAGAVVAAAISLPSLVWQATHGFPIVELLHNQRIDEVIILSAPAYVLQQVLITNPLLAPIWIFGLIFSFSRPALRWIGWTYVLLIAAMVAFAARNYFPGDVYPLLIASGALAIESAQRLRALRPAIVAAILLVSIVTIPFVFPVLAEARLADIMVAATRVVNVHIAPQRNADAILTQNFADMHGWPELTAAVARVYRTLPPPQRAHAAILAQNYGEAGAIDFYGGAYGLPPALSGHNNYWLWGSRGYDGSVVVEVNGTCGPEFRTARVAVARFTSPWIMAWEENIPISICYGLKEPLSQYWPQLRRYL